MCVCGLSLLQINDTVTTGCLHDAKENGIHHSRPPSSTAAWSSSETHTPLLTFSAVHRSQFEQLTKSIAIGLCQSSWDQLPILTACLQENQLGALMLWLIRYKNNKDRIWLFLIDPKKTNTAVTPTKCTPVHVSCQITAHFYSTYQDVVCLLVRVFVP